MVTGLTRLAWAVAMGGACVTASFAPALSAPTGIRPNGGTATLGAEDEDKANRLAERLCETLHALPEGSRPEQYEAAIVYQMSQVTDSHGVRDAAMRRLPTSCSLAPAMLTALGNAKLGDGTGAIAPASPGFGGSGFSSPGIDVGGGSVNYSSGGAL